MPGAGKSGIAEAFKEAGVPVIVMGDVIREETIKRGLEPDPENTKKIMLELREKGGPGAVASFCVDELKGFKNELVVIEGCRTGILRAVREHPKVTDSEIVREQGT